MKAKGQVRWFSRLLLVVIALGLTMAFYGELVDIVGQAFNTLLQLFRMSTEDKVALQSSKALRYAINCEAYIGAGAIGKYQENCWAAAVDNDPWLSGSPYEPGLGRKFGQATVKCFPPGTRVEKIKQDLDVYYAQKKNPKQYISSCVVEDFKLPQKLERGSGPFRRFFRLATGKKRLSFRNWIRGLGDPKYLLYYGALPSGAAEDWRVRDEDINRFAIMTATATGAGLNLLGAIAPSILKSFARVPDLTRSALGSRVSRRIGDIFNHPLHRSAVRVGLSADDQALARSLRGLTSEIDDLVLKNTDELYDEASERVIKDYEIDDVIMDKASSDREAVVRQIAKNDDITYSEAAAKFRNQIRSEVDDIAGSSQLVRQSADVEQYLGNPKRSDELVDQYKKLLNDEKKYYRRHYTEEQIESALRKEADELFSTSGPVFDDADVLNKLKKAKFADDMKDEAVKVYDRSSDNVFIYQSSGLNLDEATEKAKKVIAQDLEDGDISGSKRIANDIVETVKRYEGEENMYQKVKDAMALRYSDDYVDCGERRLKEDLVDTVRAINRQERMVVPRAWGWTQRKYWRVKSYLRHLTAIVNPKAYARMFKRVVTFPGRTLAALPQRYKSQILSDMWVWGKRIIRTRVFQIEVYNMVNRNADIPNWARKGLIAQQCRAGFSGVSWFRSLSNLGKSATCFMVVGMGTRATKLERLRDNYMPEGINTLMLNKAMLDFGRVSHEGIGISNNFGLNQYTKRYMIRLSRNDVPGGDTNIRFYAASPCRATAVVKNKTETCNFNLFSPKKVREEYPKLALRDVVEGKDGQLWFSTKPLFSFGQPPETEDWNSMVQVERREGKVREPGIVGSQIKTQFEKMIRDDCIAQALQIDSLKDYNYTRESYEKYGCADVMETPYYNRKGKITPLMCAIKNPNNFARFRDCVKKELDNMEREQLEGNEIGAKKCGETNTFWTEAEKSITFRETDKEYDREVNMLSVSFQPPNGDWSQGSSNYCYNRKSWTYTAQRYGVIAGSIAVEVGVGLAVSTMSFGTATPGVVTAIAVDTFTGGAMTFTEQLTLLGVEQRYSWPNR